MDKTDFSAFSQYIPGFDFLQNLARQATGVTPGLQPQAGTMPALGHWVAPTFSVEEIDKRIQDLRAVAFWLEQNGKALAATIQALEVQKMTLATLENMNLSLQDVAESFKMKPAPAAQASQAAEPPVQPAAEPEQAGPAVDPMQWWNSLTEQFAGIASNALQDMAGQAAKAAEQMAQTVQAGAEAAEKLAEQAREEAERMAEQVREAAQATAETVAESAVARKRSTPASQEAVAKKAPARKVAAKKSSPAAKKASASARSKPAAG